MKSIRIFVRRLIYIIKKVIPAIIKEFNSNDGYNFRTNFSNEDEAFYRRTLDKLGADYRISNHATDCLERPIKGCKALYVRGTYNFDKFMKAFHKYSNEKDARRYAQIR